MNGGGRTHYQDPNMAGLLQLGVRLYESAVGRFTQRDRIAEPPETPYPYGNSRPTVDVDPSGLYAVGPNCARECPQLGAIMANVVRQITRNIACRAAFREVGCGQLLPYKVLSTNPLQGLTIDCQVLPNGYRGLCGSPSGFTISCSNGATGGTVIHEAIHACFWRARRPYRGGRAWKCPKPYCGLQWDPAKASAADPDWEWAAERVRHACGYQER